MDQDPAHGQRWIALSAAGQRVKVLQNPVGLPFRLRFPLVPPGHPVDGPCLPGIQDLVDLVLDLSGRDGRDEIHPGLQQGGDVGVGHQFGVGDHQELVSAGHRFEVVHRSDDLADLGGGATEDPGVHGDAAVGRHRKPGLDLFQIQAPVLGMPVATDERVLLVLLLGGEGAMDGHAGHIPVQPGDVDPELGDRPGTDRARDGLQLRGDRVQRAGQTVVVEQVRCDAEDLLHRPGAGPVPDPHQRCGRGKPVGHQRLDDLSVCQMRARTAGTRLINDPSHVQPAQKLGSDGQSAQTLLHHGHHHALKALALGPWPRGPGSHRHTQPNSTPPVRDTPGPVTPYESTTREVRD